MARRRRPEPPDECSQCGAQVARDAWACPECGADEETGWDANPWLDDGQVDLPDHLTDDYDPDHDGELGIPGMPRSKRGRVLATIAAAVAIAYVWITLRHWL